MLENMKYIIVTSNLKLESTIYNLELLSRIVNLFLQTFIIIIILYFENFTFFHAKLESDVCSRVNNKTSGDTLPDLI